MQMERVNKWLLVIIINLVFLYLCKLYDKPTDRQLIDLTHPFNNKTLYWPVFKPFDLDIQYRGMTDQFWFEANDFAAAEHGGTHMDAPSHFAQGKMRMGELPISWFFGTAIVIDISEKSAADADAQLEVSDLLEWQASHGDIPPGSYVLMNSGWCKRWSNELLYLGNTEKDVNNLHFPGISYEASQWLVENTNITAVGVDTASIDHGPSKVFPAHQILYKHNKIGLENLNNLESLPPKGAQIYAFPMKIQDGSGAPARVIAELPMTSLSVPKKLFLIFVTAILSCVVLFV